MRSRSVGSGVPLKSNPVGTPSFSMISGVQSGASLSVPWGPSRTPLTRSMTKMTVSLLAIPSAGLPASPKASSAGAATRTREPMVWPSMAVWKTLLTESSTVSSSGFFSS